MQISPSLAQTLTNLNLPPYPTVTGLPQPITLRSLTSFAGALAWAWLLLVSFTGWGRLTGKLFRSPRLPASVACALGIAAVIFLGGWLNLVHAIYPGVLFAVAALGWIFYVASRNDRPPQYGWLQFWKNASRGSKILIIFTLLILALRVAATVRLGMFNVTDDSPAYLVFPQKMLALHSFAYDPFSDRRIISSLGGSYLLQAFVIAATSLTHIAMADRTLGLILLAVALFDIGIRFDLSPVQVALLEFFVYLAPQETINLTFIVLPTSLLLGMIWVIIETDQGETSVKGSFLVGAIGGAIISLKSTYLPIVGIYALIPLLAASWRAKKLTRIRFPLIAGLGALATLFAWMIAMKITSGTYLFPVLGSGVDYTTYGLFQVIPKFLTHRALIKIFLQAIALCILLAVQVLVGIKNYNSRINLLILATSAIAITAFNYRSGGDFIWRYNFPQFLCAIVIFYTATGSLLHKSEKSNKARFAFCVGLAALAGMMFYYDVAGQNPHPFRQLRVERGDYRKALQASVGGLLLSNPVENAEYQAIGQVIPDHNFALENVARPYLFDYRKHRVYIMDWPGAASPVPGWPLGETSVKLSSYLRKSAVRYVIYDYVYAGWYDMGSCTSLARPRLYSTETFQLIWISLLANHQFDQLRADYKSIYDDGKIAIIDLQQRRENGSAPLPNWTLDTSKDQICSAVLARYLANPLPRTTK